MLGRIEWPDQDLTSLKSYDISCETSVYLNEFFITGGIFWRAPLRWRNIVRSHHFTFEKIYFTLKNKTKQNIRNIKLFKKVILELFLKPIYRLHLSILLYEMQSFPSASMPYNLAVFINRYLYFWVQDCSSRNATLRKRSSWNYCCFLLNYIKFGSWHPKIIVQWLHNLIHL